MANKMESKDSIIMPEEMGSSDQVNIKVEIKEEPMFAEDLDHTDDTLKEEMKNEKKVDVHLLKNEIVMGSSSSSSEEVSRSHTCILSDYDRNFSRTAYKYRTLIKQEIGINEATYKTEAHGNPGTVNSIKTVGQEEHSEKHVLNNINVKKCDKRISCFRKLSCKQIHNDINRHKCTHCGRWFNKKGYFKTHMLIHNSGKFPKCEICGRGFIDIFRKNNHNVGNKCRKPIKLESYARSLADIPLFKKYIHNYKNSRSFSSGNLFATSYHLKCGTSVGKCYKCETCQKTFFYELIFRRHKTFVHGNTEIYQSEVYDKSFVKHHKFQTQVNHHIRKTKYQCDTCDKCFTHPSKLKSHVFIHRGIKPYKCKTCGKGFTQHSSLKRHLNSHTGIKPHKCEICGKSFTQCRDLKFHVNIHTGGKPYKCETCGKYFNHSSNLKRHVKIHTGIKPYRCEICGKCFTQSSSLKRHASVHTGIKPYKCEICGKSFTQCTDLKIHVRSHTGIKPYTCESCGKSFTQSSGLKVHVHTHTGIKPHKCETCGKYFAHRSKLKIHVGIHSDIRPYKCETCGKCFTQHPHLKNHVLTHAGIKPYNCETCGKYFTESSALKRHLHTHTGIKP